MKKFTKALAIIMALALSAAVFTACGGSGTESKSESAASSQSADSTPADTTEAKVVDYSKPDVTIESGDYDGMKSFANEMLEGKHDGEVIKVNGISTRSNMGVKGSILISDGKSSKIGVTYKIAGVDSIEKFPAEDAEVIITGVVKTDENGIRYIEVPEDKVESK